MLTWEMWVGISRRPEVYFGRKFDAYSWSALPTLFIGASSIDGKGFSGINLQTYLDIRNAFMKTSKNLHTSILESKKGRFTHKTFYIYLSKCIISNKEHRAIMWKNFQEAIMLKNPMLFKYSVVWVLVSKDAHTSVLYL